MAEQTSSLVTGQLPRVTIQFCTQCKWMLRAAYYAQELLSTFSTGLGEVALQPATGGVFVVTIDHGDTAAAVSRTLLWDRKVDGGFPETKELKRRVRDVIEPGRDLGHVDRDHAREGKKKKGEGEGEGEPAREGKTACEVRPGGAGGEVCEDCN